MGHGHRHHGAAGASTTADGERRVFWALPITVSFMLAEGMAPLFPDRWRFSPMPATC